MSIKDELDRLESSFDLGGKIALVGRKKGEQGKAKKLTLELVRNLAPSDLEVYQETSLGVSTPILKSLRSAHHRIAWLMAMGKPDVDISQITGYSSSRLSILKRDPAFSELLVHYEKTNQLLDRNMVDKLATLSTDAIEVLQEMLHDNPDNFTVGQLLEMIKTGADRSEAPPITKSHNLTETRSISAQLIHEIKEIVHSNQKGTISESHDTQVKESRIVLESSPNVVEIQNS